MKYRTIGTVMLMLLAVMSSAFALTQDKAIQQCKQSFEAGNSCIVAPYEGGSMMVKNLQTPSERYTWYVVKNANDFDTYLNKYISLRDVKITNGDNKNMMAVIGKEKDKSKRELFDEVYGSTYLNAAKLFNAPQISFAVRDYFNIVELEILPENPRPDTSLSGGATWTNIYAGSGVYKEPSLN